MGRSLGPPKTYPPKSWECPGCGKSHKGPHYSLPGQINYKKKPSDKGRVVFNRRLKDDRLDSGTKIKAGVPNEGDSFDDEGFQRPLFCPHCGWEDEWLVIKRTGKLRSLIDQFKDIMNGNVEEISAENALQQFMGFLKGKGIVA